MTSEIAPQPLPWNGQEALHPKMHELLQLPFDDLLRLAAETLTEGKASLEAPEDNPSANEFTVTAGIVKIGENAHAEEFIKMQATKRSVSAVYGSRYKGVIGAAIQPISSWAISVEDDGTRYKWDERTHGETEAMFALAATDCDELPSADNPGAETDPDLLTMRRYVALALCAHEDPSIVAKAGKSVIPPFDLAAHVQSQTVRALAVGMKPSFDA